MRANFDIADAFAANIGEYICASSRSDRTIQRFIMAVYIRNFPIHFKTVGYTDTS